MISENDKYQERFEKVWAKAGPIFCEKNSLVYVTYNMAEAQKIELGPIHYIFALDESGSMEGESWDNMIKSFKETLKKLRITMPRDKIFTYLL